MWEIKVTLQILVTLIICIIEGCLRTPVADSSCEEEWRMGLWDKSPKKLSTSRENVKEYRDRKVVVFSIFEEHRLK